MTSSRKGKIMTRQDKLIQKLKKLKGNQGVVAEYCDTTFMIKKCMSDGAYIVNEVNNNEYTVEGCANEIEVVKYIYGEYIEGCAGGNE